jgi:hypothetical protein
LGASNDERKATSYDGFNLENKSQIFKSRKIVFKTITRISKPFSFGINSSFRRCFRVSSSSSSELSFRDSKNVFNISFFFLEDFFLEDLEDVVRRSSNSGFFGRW